MKIFFKKIENNHNRLRDDVIEGEMVQSPHVGKMFCMVAPPRDRGNIRFIRTSPVTEIISQELNTTIFKTKSGSIYSVEVKLVQ